MSAQTRQHGRVVLVVVGVVVVAVAVWFLQRGSPAEQFARASSRVPAGATIPVPADTVGADVGEAAVRGVIDADHDPPRMCSAPVDGGCEPSQGLALAGLSEGSVRELAAGSGEVAFTGHVRNGILQVSDPQPVAPDAIVGGQRFEVTIGAEFRGLPDPDAGAFNVYLEGHPVGTLTRAPVTFELWRGEQVTVEVHRDTLEVPIRRLTEIAADDSQPAPDNGLLHLAVYRPPCGDGDHCIKDLRVIGIATSKLQPGTYDVAIPVRWVGSTPDDGTVDLHFTARTITTE